MAFGERVAEALEELRRRDADALLPPLREQAEQVVLGPAVDDCFANVSPLVHRGRLDEVERAVEELQKSLNGLVRLRVNGPLPPYSFVTQPDRPADRPPGKEG